MERMEETRRSERRATLRVNYSENNEEGIGIRLRERRLGGNGIVRRQPVLD